MCSASALTAQTASTIGRLPSGFHKPHPVTIPHPFSVPPPQLPLSLQAPFLDAPIAWPGPVKLFLVALLLSPSDMLIRKGSWACASDGAKPPALAGGRIQVMFWVASIFIPGGTLVCLSVVPMQILRSASSRMLLRLSCPGAGTRRMCG